MIFKFIMINLYNLSFVVTFSITTINCVTDFAVGRIKKNDFPREYAKIHFMLSLERFKRCLDIYPEFKNHLSDYDRSLIWKRNHSIAAGLLACKVIY